MEVQDKYISLACLAFYKVISNERAKSSVTDLSVRSSYFLMEVVMWKKDGK